MPSGKSDAMLAKINNAIREFEQSGCPRDNELAATLELRRLAKRAQ